MTLTEQKYFPLAVNDWVDTFDEGLVSGLVTGIGEETFTVEWNDEIETEYKISEVEIIGDFIKTNKNRS